jgi:hypothetical protein
MAADVGSGTGGVVVSPSPATSEETKMNLVSRKTVWALFAMLFFSYAYVHQREYRAPTPVSRLDLLHAIFTHKTLNIDAYHNTGDRAQYNGHYYSDKAPGGAFVALPGFAIATGLWRLGGGSIESESGWLFTSWLASVLSMGLLAAVGGVFLFLLLCEWVSERTAMLTTLALYLGAAPFPYATQLFTHGMTVGLVSMILYWLKLFPVQEVPEVTRRGLILAGLAAGLIMASEFTAGIVIYGIGLLVFSRGLRYALIFSLAAVPMLCLIPLYSWLCFDSPFVIGYSHQASYPTMREGFFGIREPEFKTILDLTLGPCRGLFFWTPFLLLLLPGFNLVYPRNRAAFWLTFIAPCIQLIVLSGYFDWKAGYTLGPRYLAPCLPLLAIPAALGAQKYPRLAIALAAASILLTGGGTLITAAPFFDDFPLMTQHWPKLLRGEYSYNLGSVLGVPSHLSVLLLVAVWIAGGVWLYRRTSTLNPQKPCE